MKSSLNPRRMTVLALLTTIALAIYYAESLLPPPVPIPGIKLGLANIITLLILRNASFRDAFLVLLMRILISSLLFGQAMSLFYSLSGGILCLLVMYLINKLLQGHFLFLTSIFGAIFHQLGQLTAACMITSSMAAVSYLPFFIISGTVTGLFTGLCALFSQKYVQKLFRGQLL